MNKPFVCIAVNEAKHKMHELEFGKQPRENIGDIYISRLNRFNSESYLYGTWREATLDELKEHFK